MEIILQGIKEGILLLWSMEPEIMQITLLTLQVSLTALFLATLIGIPLGALLALKEIPGKRLFLNTVYTLMGLPPVLAGLLVYLFLTSQGPLGHYQLLFTPTAMIIAQFILALPIVTGLTARAVMAQKQEVYDTAVTLGATRVQAINSIIREARLGIAAGITTAFGRVIAEVGAVMMVGGNIKETTRVLTTSIVLETRVGNDSMAIALGLILLLLAFLVNLVIILLERRSFKNETTIKII
ncbi:Tungstate ABC transporter, permease protein [Candidatus Syntrophocurvum alkaliphilum]|uniref:Tungstate ABC transporter, permease protein n=1 Tax=Candidatus Syntrophocurvum alkaliphilum TaxID=2293317 RepID=A0A6I6DFW4_9FIRM|nr:ABC transporter permease [Candidatus Syntrophocurvum alkaliphilum]QGT98609.1 Tungstate ABC transporter, permease protein [Candidatus Syntrophocurvum alkaliphilum]